MATLTFHSPRETQAWGKHLASVLKAGDVIALIGALGAGKTTFVQGLARGRGYRGDVNSPTFSLVNEYRSRRGLLLHMDMYRLTPEELKLFPLEDYLDPSAICVMEWADRIRSRWPQDILELQLSTGNQTTRTLHVRRPSAAWRQRLKDLTA